MSPFFHTWELRDATSDPQNPKPRSSSTTPPTPRPDRQQKLLVARAVYGFFPANAVGTMSNFTPTKSRRRCWRRFHFLRQQMDKATPIQPLPRRFHRPCIGDGRWKREDGREGFGAFRLRLRLRLSDFLGAFAVTPVLASKTLPKFGAATTRYNSIIMTKALRRWPKLSRYLHQRVRRCGYGRTST